jgi:REP element-mobilizing transposase RayT
MSDKYKIWDQNKPYFLTLTVSGWIDIFVTDAYKFIIIDSLKHCQKEKGMDIFGYCIMPTHIHLIVRANKNFKLSDVLRDFKKFTSKAIVKLIINEYGEGGNFLLNNLKASGRNKKGRVICKFWQEGNHPVEITSNEFFDEKLDYIHNNPVNANIVEKPEDYIFSSARNYAGLSNHLDVVLEIVKQRFYK